jgi:hypothetical protein
MATATQGTAKTIDEGSTIQALALTKLAGGSDPPFVRVESDRSASKTEYERPRRIFAAIQRMSGRSSSKPVGKPTSARLVVSKSQNPNAVAVC